MAKVLITCNRSIWIRLSDHIQLYNNVKESALVLSQNDLNHICEYLEANIGSYWTSIADMTPVTVSLRLSMLGSSCGS